MALWKIFLISLGFAYDFSFCQNHGWFKIIPPKNIEKTISRKIFFGEYVKISRFHHIPGSWTNGPHFLKIFLISLAFAYDFSFCQNYGSFKIIPPKNIEKPISHKIFSGNMSKYQDSTTFLVHEHIVHTSQKYFDFTGICLWFCILSK